MTQALLRPRAETDLVERTRYYRDEAGEHVGERFFDSAIAALHTIETMPCVGSLRLGELCAIAGLRSFRIVGFACGWFYFERNDDLDVVRLLSYAQDVPALLADIDEG